MTFRQKLVLLAALTYAKANTDDVNDALHYNVSEVPLPHDKIRVGNNITDPLTEMEISELELANQPKYPDEIQNWVNTLTERIQTGTITDIAHTLCQIVDRNPEDSKDEALHWTHLHCDQFNKDMFNLIPVAMRYRLRRAFQLDAKKPDGRRFCDKDHSLWIASQLGG